MCVILTTEVELYKANKNSTTKKGLKKEVREKKPNQASLLKDLEGGKKAGKDKLGKKQ